jgi:hypothetical protein
MFGFWHLVRLPERGNRDRCRELSSRLGCSGLSTVEVGVMRHYGIAEVAITVWANKLTVIFTYAVATVIIWIEIQGQ